MATPPTPCQPPFVPSSHDAAPDAQATPTLAAAAPGGLPPTPQPLRTPRRVRVLRGLLGFAVVVPSVLLELGGRMDAAGLRTLMEEGHVIAAEVTGKHVRRGRSVDHFVDASFRFEGRMWEVCERVPFARFDAAASGDATEVTFLADCPDRAVLDRVDQERVERALIAGRVAAVVLGLSFLCVLAAFEVSLRRGR